MNSHRFLKNNEEKIKGDFIINHFNLDEKCLGVFDLNMGENSPCMILHYDECWYTSGHECPDLPDEIELQTDIYNSPTITHIPLTSNVMGDLTLAGCYVDWDLLKK